MILFLFGLFTGSMIVEQVHFDKCKKVGFNNEACVIEKKLCKLGEDKARCEK